MVTLYDKKNKDSIDKSLYIHDVEKYFRIKEIQLELLKNENSDSIMKAIDNIAYRKDYYIETPFGGCSVDNLSSGCKALLLANYYGNTRIVNFVECGNNVIEYAIKKDMNISIYVPQVVVLKDIAKVVYNSEIIEWG